MGRDKAGGESEYEVDDEVFPYCGYHGEEYVHCQEQRDEVRRRLHCLFVVGVEWMCAKRGICIGQAQSDVRLKSN